MKNLFFLLLGCILSFPGLAQVSKVWVADQGNGTYKNPVLHADYSDPDAIRVGEDYYMTASSFTQTPGLPLLHSKDLVNWKLIGHALPELPPIDVYQKVQHGAGVWAPSIRYHQNKFYIFFPDPDFGIYLITASNILGPWSKPELILAGKGLIDPCPLWDDDGKAYLVHAYAGSRAGIKSILVVREMDASGKKVGDKPVMVFDGHETDPTVEGPKCYKRNGYYYIFAPAGGVSTGWQLVLRSKNIYGPYERKVVMAQGNTPINGPHQGAWVTTAKGEDWFLHFQDKEAYGRIVHLQPMTWKNDWPVIGEDPDGDGTGQPVMTYKKPATGKVYPKITPPDSDEFNSVKWGSAWQWQANPAPHWAFPTNAGYLRLFSVQADPSLPNKWSLPHILGQKFPAETFTATVKLTGDLRHEGEQFGLMVHGLDYGVLSLQKRKQGIILQYAHCLQADKGSLENGLDSVDIKQLVVYLRVRVIAGAQCYFGYSLDGKIFQEFTQPFTAKPGKWVGARIGVFGLRNNSTNDAGYADLDWFRVEKPLN